MVELRGIRYRAGGREIVDDVSAAFPAGAMTVLLGPNGAGKSTLLRIAAGLLVPTAGEVRYDGRPVGAFGAEALARVRAVLAQHAMPAFPLSAEDVVEMGRYPHYARVPGRRDREAVERALAAVGMVDRRAQRFATLSAGERQKIQMARVLAQMDAGPDGGGGRVLFLDEPTTSLDVRHQLQLLDIARGLLAHGVTVIAVLHDVNHACTYGDHLLVLDAGRLVYAGTRAQGLSAELLAGVYRVPARRVTDAADGRALWHFGD